MLSIYNFMKWWKKTNHKRRIEEYEKRDKKEIIKMYKELRDFEEIEMFKKIGKRALIHGIEEESKKIAEIYKKLKIEY